MSERELDQLRDLLLKPEQQRLAALEKYASTPEQRLQELNQMLPPALHQSAEDGRLASALAGPVKNSLRSAIREDAKGLAEVLFPVMGPSIRRAIAESLRDFVGNLNGAVAEAVSWQGLRWRIEAWRSGRAYGEVVLSHTLSYRVEQALLIHQASGLVISKAELSAVVANDSDAFSAMLTAIQDFVSDSLKGDSKLSTIDMGERTIWIIRGPHAQLACVISGMPKHDLREHLANVLDDVHNHYGGLIEEFSGDPQSVAGIDQYTQRCLGSLEPQHSAKKPSRWPFSLLLLLLLVLLLWWCLRTPALSVDQQVYQALSDTPGLAVQRVQKIEGRWLVSGLRDPLSVDPKQRLAQAGLPIENIDFKLQAFQSLEPSLVLQRLRSALRMPAGIHSELAGEQLTLSGEASWDWLDRIKHRSSLPDGIKQIDTQQVHILYGLDALRQDLPDGVRLEMQGGALKFSGQAEWGWIQQLRQWLSARSGLPLAAQQALIPVEWSQLQVLVKLIHGQSIFFSDVIELEASQRAKLQVLTEQLHQANQLSSVLGVAARLTLTAYSDGLGTKERNQEIRVLRAAKVAALVNPQGDLSLPIIAQPHSEYVAAEVANLSLRRVDVGLVVDKPPENWQ